MDVCLVDGYAFECIKCFSLVHSRCYYLASNIWSVRGVFSACQLLRTVCTICTVKGKALSIVKVQFVCVPSPPSNLLTMWYFFRYTMTVRKDRGTYSFIN